MTVTHPLVKAKTSIRIAAVFVLLTTACSTLPVSTDDPSVTVPTSDTPTTTPEPSATTSDDSPETLAEFFGVQILDDPQAAEAAREQANLLFQEDLRTCMAEEGFDYVPVLPRLDEFTVVEATEEDRVRQWGFGITTSVGSGIPDVIDTSWFSTDPNEDQIATMSEAEKEAWDEALDECGTEVARSSPEATMESVLFELSFEFEDLVERVESDPRVVELEIEWSRCMGENGYEYSDRDDLLTAGIGDLQAGFDTLMGEEATFEPFAGWSAADIEEFIEGKSEEEIAAFFKEADQNRLERIDSEALAALQQEEIYMAVSDFECRQNLDFEETRESVREEYEANFISSNRETLEQIRDAQSG